ncbi:MAG TPA: hypothetical protein VGP08_16415 [Pyrinomonadaceae bacterium]|jgi:hypothetical protein|nr:hypothetical protein [Pyrinomonadaceae bacterium]
MSNNNPQTVGVIELADLIADLKKDFPRPHDRIWTVEEVAAIEGKPSANGGGPGVATSAGVATRLVSGRYEGTEAGGEFRLELRVDVDGRRPTLKVSGDLFQKSGGDFTHWGSFRVDKLDIEALADKVTLKGTAKYSRGGKPPVVVVSIRRAPADKKDADAPPADKKETDAPPAEVTLSTFNPEVVGERYTCAFASPFFRAVQYELDMLKGTEAFDSYDTGALTSGGPKRTLTLETAYAEAGIEMKAAGKSNVIEDDVINALAKTDRKWSDTELHDAMVQQFSLLRGAALKDWKLWVLVATEHEQADTRGMMFDSGRRQGCAVFHNLVNKGEDPARKRAALRTYMHEVGHCFNLLHSWEKHTNNTNISNRPDSLSYMNYVEKFPEGNTPEERAEAYWKKFAFEFDDPELLHLRHAFRDNIIMGGNFFGTGAAEFEVQTFNRPLTAEDSGLTLKLEARKSFMLCEPVVIEVKLYWNGSGCKMVYESIHPDRGFVQLAIRKPDGRIVPYRPFISHCVDPTLTDLCVHQPSIYASAYIGYGRDGFYFGEAGFYQIVAVYYSPCGAEVISEPLDIRVRNPLNEVEEDIADHYYGHDEGALFYLLGSDSEHLSSGNRSLDNVLDKYGDHPLAIHAQVVKGVNDGRLFKKITEGNRLAARAPLAADSSRLLSQVVDPEITGAGFFRRLWDTVTFRRRAAYEPPLAPRLDNITLNMCVRRLARAKKRMGDEKGADQTLDAALAYFDSRVSRPHVLARIKAQLEKTRGEKY